jgi:nitrogen regulatory protein PII-like uncharacterized protein
MKYILIAEIELVEAPLKDVERMIKSRIEDDRYNLVSVSVKKIKAHERTEATKFTYDIYE